MLLTVKDKQIIKICDKKVKCEKGERTQKVSCNI